MFLQASHTSGPIQTHPKALPPQRTLSAHRHAKTQTSPFKTYKSQKWEEKLATATILEMDNCVYLSKMLSRKNTLTFEKKEKTRVYTQQVSSGKEQMTPYQNRKKKERMSFDKKLKELKERRSICYLLEENVKNWIVVNQIGAKPQSKVNETQSIFYKEGQQIQNKGKDKIYANNSSCSLTNKQKTKTEKLMKSKYALLLKNHSRKYKSNLFRHNSLKSDQNHQSYHKILIQNTSSVQKQPKSPQMACTKLVFSKERCKSINVSKIQKQMSSKNTFPLKVRDESYTAQMVRGSKIGIMNKTKSRPQTAVIKRPKANFNSKRNHQNRHDESAFREVSGWQQITDCFQKQIIF